MKGRMTMTRYFLAAALIGAFAASASAMDTFYIVFDKDSKTCSMAKSPPTETEKFSMMGQYGSEAEAMTAMKGMKECKAM
jgi:hypothetical protein